MSGAMVRDLMSDVLGAFVDEPWDWTFVDAANEATGPPFAVVARRWPQGPYREWWNAMDQPDGAVKYVGLDRSIAFMRQVLTQRTPYSLLMGFSQGCVLATILTALAERGELALAARWRGVVLFNSGTPPRDPRLLPLFEGRPLETPSIHVLGGPSDPLYGRQKAGIELWSAGSRVVLEHSEGHSPPSAKESPEILAQLRGAVLKLIEEAAGR